ncbi:MAG: 1-phosphofructokinase family hexose kinase [Devosia sp.]|nr:1-phosphofructokinase family hexose kinase [Devosia sp.]
MSASSILTVTLNPALDVTTSVERMKPMQKLRCRAPRYDPGGGGVNVSRAIKELGGTSHAFVALAGCAGQRYRQILEGTGIESEIWPMSGETRFSLTVMEHASGLQYRFLLPGPEQDAEEADRLLSALTGSIGKGYRFVVASGSLPPGLPADFYGRLASRTRELGAALILDTSGPALRAAMAQRPFLIRLNHYEAQELVGGSSDAEAATYELVGELLERNAAETVIVTVGEQGAIVATGGQLLRIHPPKVRVVSAVGAGDSFVAALTLGLAQDWPLEKASRYAVAAAAAVVTTEATQLCDRATTEKLFEETAGQAERLD